MKKPVLVLILALFVYRCGAWRGEQKADHSLMCSRQAEINARIGPKVELYSVKTSFGRTLLEINYECHTIPYTKQTGVRMICDAAMLFASPVESEWRLM